MKPVVVIKRDNKKVLDVIAKLHDVKKELRAHIASGEPVKNFNSKKKTIG